MICLSCTSFSEGDNGDVCRACRRPLVAETRANHEALIERRVRRLLEHWSETGRLDVVTRARLEAALPPGAYIADEEAVRREAELQREQAARREEEDRRAQARRDSEAQAAKTTEAASADALRTRSERQARKLAARGRKLERARQREHRATDATNTDPSTDLGRAVFGADGAVLGGALEAIAAVDGAEDPPGLSPDAREYVWWFIGTLLIVAGSIMGVREAWRSLSGVPRQLLVAGALFAYHAAFVGLAAMLARRSNSTGRVIGVIAIALTPIVYVALAALVDLVRGPGVFLALLFVPLTWFSLGLVSARFGAGAGQHVPLVLLPSLIAELPLSTMSPTFWMRLVLPFVGLGAVGLATHRRALRTHDETPSWGLVACALYGALALVLFGLVGTPVDGPGLAPIGPRFDDLTSVSLALWVTLLGGVLADATAGAGARRHHPRAAPSIEVLMLGLVAAGALGAALTAFRLAPSTTSVPEGYGLIGLGAATTSIAAALIFRRAEPRHPTAFYPATLAGSLASALVFRVLCPLEPAWWAFGGSLAAAASLYYARHVDDPQRRVALLAWGGVLGAAMLSAAGYLEAGPTAAPMLATSATGLVLGLSAHAAGGLRLRGFHYLGGVALVGAAAAFLAPVGSVTATRDVVWVLLGGSAIAALIAEPFEARAGAGRFHPFDDLARVCCLAALGMAILASAPAPGFLLLPGTTSADLAPLAQAGAAMVILCARSPRDRSRLFTVPALAPLPFLAFCYTGAQSSSQIALVLSTCALATALLALIRDRDDAPLIAGVSVIGTEPSAAPPPRTLLADGLIAASVLAATGAVLAVVQWISVRVEAERPWAIAAGAGLVLWALIAFTTRAFGALRLRGVLPTLFCAGGFVAMTAIVNRIGRPLPPAIVGRNLTVILALIWWVARLTVRHGAWLGARLGREDQGRRYHFVPHAGVVALGALLVVDAALVAASAITPALWITPPMLLLGGALASILLGRSARSAIGLVIAHPLLLCLGALVAAQHALFGPELITQIMGGPWMRPEGAQLPAAVTTTLLWDRAATGLASVACALALLSRLAQRRGLGAELVDTLTAQRDEAAILGVERGARAFSLIGCAAAFLVACALPRVESALLVLGSGALLLSPRGMAHAGVLFAAGGAMLIHAIAHLGPRVPLWTGPVLAALASAVLLAHAALRGGDTAKRTPRSLQRLAGALIFFGLVYALAAGGVTDRDGALARLLVEVGQGMDGRWLSSPSLPITCALSAIPLLLLAAERDDAPGAAAVVLAILFAAIGASLEVMRQSLAAGAVADPGLRMLLLAATGCALAAVTQLLLWRRGEASSCLRAGARWGRDLLLLWAGGLMAAAIVARGAVDASAGMWLGCGLLAVFFCTSAIAAGRERTTRHVYLTQLAVVGGYSFVRAQLGARLAPEIDAVFALALGFVLVGVTVAARRARLSAVAKATRRFAACLPVLALLVMPKQLTGALSLVAGGSSLLYATLAAVERSRAFGSLGAIACNLAILFLTLRWDVQGVEVYLGPVGLLVLMLEQILGRNMEVAARRTVQTLGGLLVYAPAGLSLALQVGDATDGAYAVTFGAICLLGVLVGMLFHIRAYVLLGVSFLVLDVTANLFHMSRRDHRVAFWVLSLAGLAILAIMVLMTTKRDRMQRLIRNARARFETWQ